MLTLVLTPLGALVGFLVVITPSFGPPGMGGTAAAVTALGIGAVLTWVIKKYSAREALAHPLAFGAYVAWSLVSSLFLTPLALLTMDSADWGTRTKEGTRGGRWRHYQLSRFPRKQRSRRLRQSLHYKLVISLYRVFALTMSYLLLGGILAYALVMGFYAVNSSWAAPVILSAADEKSLAFREKLVTSQQTIEDLKVDSQKMQSGIAEMKKHRAALLALEPQLQEAIARERRPQPRHRASNSRARYTEASRQRRRRKRSSRSSRKSSPTSTKISLPG